MKLVRRRRNSIFWRALLVSMFMLPLFQNCERSFLSGEFSINSISVSEESNLADPTGESPQGGAQKIGALTQAACVQNPQELCLQWRENSEASEVSLSSLVTNAAIESGFLGGHAVGGQIRRLAYAYYLISANETQLSVVDLDRKRVIAATRANAGAPIFGTNLGILRGPQDLKYPFLSPGYVPSITASSWMWVCRFDPSLLKEDLAIQTPASDCGTGFRRFSIDFKTPQGQPAYQIAASKHSGFMIDDVDQDGWEDITFPFFQGHLVSFSGQTGAQIGFSQFDVASAEGDYGPHYHANQRPLFHGGRLYGVFFKVKESNVPMQVVVAGDIVGRFQDGEWCNVTRYVAGFRWNQGFQLAWSHYVGWGRTLFNDDGKASRRGDEVGRCIHRISDSVLNENSKSYVIYNQFDVTDRRTQCDRLALNYQGNISSAEAAEKYSLCLSSVAAKKPGAWNLNILDAKDGRQISSLGNHYVWGRVDKVWPDTSKALFLLHQNHPDGSYAQTAEDLKAFTLAYVQDGQFAPLSTLECPSAVPRLREGTVGGHGFGTYAPGKNTSTDNVGLKDVTIEDIDGDGLNDILLADGRWIGYAQGKLSYKNGAVPNCVRRAKIKWQSDGLLACRLENGSAVVSSSHNGESSEAQPTSPMTGAFVTVIWRKARFLISIVRPPLAGVNPKRTSG